MSPSDRRQLVDAAFAEAIELAVEDRAAFLDQACPDAAFRAEVEAMLAADAQADAYFQAAADRLAVSAEEVTARPPERAGPWRPVRLLGRGGMGDVYLAERAGAETPDGFAQRAALKLVQPGLAPNLVARFHAERRILAGLEHPGIARLLDGGTASDGRPYLAMEVVDGEPITTYCDRRRLDVEERLRLFVQACEAVQYAHRQLVVHRDLKPSNVLVTELETGERRVKLLDFGVARLVDEADVTWTDARALTPEYAAPEQLRGETSTAASDIYALGVLLYEMLAGQRPFRIPNRLALEAARIVLEEPPTDPSTAIRHTETAEAVAQARATRPEQLRRRLQGDLDRIAQMALRKEPDRRYASADAFSRDIQRHLEGFPVEAGPTSVGYRFRRFVRRHRAGVVGAALGGALLIVYAATVTVQRAEIARERDRAEQTVGLLSGLFEDADPYRDEEDRDPDLTAATPLGDALYASAQALAGNPEVEPEIRHSLLGTLAGTLASLGADSLALELDRRRVELAMTAFGAESARTAEALGAWGNRLSQSHTDSLQLARADSLLRRGLYLMNATVGPEARETGDALVRLATFLKDHGDPDEARDLAGRAVAIARRQPDADLATALMIYGLALGRAGDTGAAYEVAVEAVEQARANRGEGSVNLASVLANAAHAAEAAGRLEEALGYEQQAAALTAEHLGPHHATTLAIRSNMATTLHALDRLASAEAMHREVLAQRLATLGATHPDVGVSYQQLASVVWDAGRLEEAAGLYRQAATVFDGALPVTTPTRAFPYLSLARLEADLGQYEAAASAAREARRLALQSVGPEHLMLGDAEVRLGRALLGQGQRRDGLRHLDAGLAILRRALGDEAPQVEEAIAWRTSP